MAPERYVSWNWSRLIKQAMMSTIPAIVKGTGKELLGVESMLLESVEVTVSMQCVPLELYPEGQVPKQSELRKR